MPLMSPTKSIYSRRSYPSKRHRLNCLNRIFTYTGFQMPSGLTDRQMGRVRMASCQRKFFPHENYRGGADPGTPDPYLVSSF